MSTLPTKFSSELAAADFDFDAWVKLAALDPAAFEQAKRDLLMQAVGEAPVSQRAQLTGLVNELMAPPSGNPSGLERAVTAQNAMMQGMYALQDQMKSLKTELGASPEAESVDASLAQFTTLIVVNR